MAKPFLFEQMSWKEIESAQKKTRTVVIPLSLLEEHGPHLPVSVDYLRAYEIAKRVKKNFFLLPPIIIGNTGKYSFAFPGTISISEKTLKRLIVEMCESLHFTGFRKIFVFSGHNGRKHSKAAEQAAGELRKKKINACELTSKEKTRYVAISVSFMIVIYAALIIYVVPYLQSSVLKVNSCLST